ncbi:hypothetical protein [Geodermatophilus maliterrae]|uniref:Mce-associated membrane protein n=1 Tax=Geodermatophilus maliterrae TaxID=3162531 RepID=A0ABV3XB42_9ACTN
MSSASGGGATVEEREGVKNRRQDWRSALIGAASGLVATAIAFGGVLYGTNVTADRDDDRSNREFLQTQRIAVYGEYLTAVDDSYSLMRPWIPDPFVVATIREVRDFQTPSDEESRAIYESIQRLNTIVGRLQVVGGAEVYEIASHLRSDLNAGMNTIAHVTGCKTQENIPEDVCARDQFLKGGQAYWPDDDFQSDREEYLEAAQGQLGVSD